MFSNQESVRCKVGSTSSKKIVAVTVTYGNRRNLLNDSLQGMHNSGVSHVIVVNNGANYNVQEAISSFDESFVSIISFDRNKGSAVGFRAGLEAALLFECEYILILDDDNLIGQQYVGRLIAVIESSPEPTQTAAFGYRSGHGGLAVDLEGLGIIRHIDNSFLAFHVLDVPTKIFRRIFPPKSTRSVNQANLVSVASAPYGGLIFSPLFLKKYGLPNPDFVLYQDDTEFTLRITSAGGKIILLRDENIVDLDQSWADGASRSRSSFSKYLKDGPDFRVFYTVRNHAWVDRKLRAKNPMVFWMNFSAYVSIVIVLGLLYRRLPRMKLVLKAILHGARGRLGEFKDLPLP